jgi:hypothetical protein
MTAAHQQLLLSLNIDENRRKSKQNKTIKEK